MTEARADRHVKAFQGVFSAPSLPPPIPAVHPSGGAQPAGVPGAYLQVHVTFPTVVVVVTAVIEVVEATAEVAALVVVVEVAVVTAEPVATGAPTLIRRPHRGRRRSASPQGRRPGGASDRTPSAEGTAPPPHDAASTAAAKNNGSRILRFTALPLSFIEPSTGCPKLTGGRMRPESLTSSSSHHPGQCPLPGPNPGV